MTRQIFSYIVVCLVIGVVGCRQAAEQSAATGRDAEATSVNVSPVVAADRNVAASSDDDGQAARTTAGEENIDSDKLVSVSSDEVIKDDGAENAKAADEEIADETTEGTAAEDSDDEQAAGEKVAETGEKNGAQPADEGPVVEEKAEEFAPLPPVKGLSLLSKSQQIWIDREKKRVVFDGEVCLTAGRLELLVSHENGKTHESVVKVKAKASTVHAALLAVGGRQGTPVIYRPEYKPATGGVVEILVRWWDKNGKMHEMPGQRFARNMVTRKALSHEWVFAGSYFWKDERTGKTLYVADPSGDFICVSNFPTAMLDLPIESSSTNEGLVYEAFTENIPPKGTKVRLILTPRRDQQGDDPTTKDPTANDPTTKEPPAAEQPPATDDASGQPAASDNAE